MQYTMVIADDEEIECKALGLLIKKECPQVHILGYAANGIELVHLLEKHRPDIAIVDINMPGIDGIKAIELAKKMNLFTRFIINTAYDDFTFAQKALSLKVDSYILKPQNRAETVSTIQKLCQEITRNRETQKSKAQVSELLWNIQSVIESEIIYSIFIGEPATSSFSMWCEMHAIEFSGGLMVTIVPQPANGAPAALGGKEALRQVLHETLKGFCVFLASVNDVGINLLLFIADNENISTWQSWAFDVVSVLLAALQKSLRVEVRAGIGAYCPLFADMTLSYQQSLAALRDVNEAGIGMFWEEIGTGKSTDRLLACATKVVEYASTGNIKQAEETLEKEKSGLIAEAALPLTFWLYCQNLISKILSQKQIVDYHPFFNMVWQLLKNTRNEQQRYEKLKENVKLLAQMLQEGKSNVVSPHVTQAVQYIRKHYAQDLSLEDVSASIGISPYYLSRLMKQDLNQSFIAYLTQVRIQKAISLIKTTKLTIAEISENVGYTNSTYFCRVFKKVTGQTVGKIRSAEETFSVSL